MKRGELFSTFFGGGAPKLWCPLISHYDRRGNFDVKRFEAHLAHISPYVGGFLAPGSTGDGWEMEKAEAFELVDMLRELLSRHRRLLLIGVLETGQGDAARSAEAIKIRYGFDGDPSSLEAQGLCGITVTPPKGAELPEEVIEEELGTVLSVGLPTALYQLPQVTENRISPQTAAVLAGEYENFYLFKDTSGEDRIALDAELPENLFLVRGAEGGYYRWLRGAGGPYHGFLLSTANSFPRDLSEIIEAVEEGDIEHAKQITDKLAKVVQELFRLVEALPFGNPFANANKVADHFMAYGESWTKGESPMTHAREPLPLEILEAAAELLESNGLISHRGYLDAGQ